MRSTRTYQQLTYSPKKTHTQYPKHRYNALGLGMDIGRCLVKQQELFELLCFYFYMCCQPQGKTIWPQQWAWDLKDPNMCYPWMITSSEKDNEHDIFFEKTYKEKKPQLAGLKNLQLLVGKMPKVRTMANWAAKGKDADGVSVLHREMVKLYPKNGLMLPVVRWLYTSNRAHFRRLRKDEMLKQVDSEYQYVLMTGSMDKETRFQELKRETAFAREVMTKWNLTKVDASLRTAYGKRKNEVMFLICDQSTLWMAKSRLAVATEAVRAAVKKLAEDTSRDDIDSRVVKTAIDILKKSLDSVVKTVFDVFKAQAQALTAAGKPPAVNHRVKSTAQSATGIGSKGSFFAWHGSQVARWHLMIRTGLRNLSGTKLQAFGVAYVVFEREAREF